VARRAKVGAIAAALAAVSTLEMARASSGMPFSPQGLALRSLFVAAVLWLARMSQPSRRTDGRWSLPGAGLACALAGALAAAAAFRFQSLPAAGLALSALFSVTLAAATVPARPGRRAGKLVRVLALAAAAGSAAIAAVEIESQFAHEEIFAALAAVSLSGGWLWLWLALEQLPTRHPDAPPGGVAVRPAALALGSLSLGAAGLFATVLCYQASFSPDPPLAYPGISTSEPFLCGRGEAASGSFEGRRVFAELLSRIEANSRRSPPEEGMLALATDDGKRAALFRSGLLEEAARETLSRHGPTKYWQYEASLRAYFYPRVRSAFPGLFSAEDERLLAAWFHAINARALAPGLDDAIYAVAFRKRPEGPYENQENGAGLLAVLEAGGLARPDLSARNRQYLDRAPRGWEARFRNNDDSYGYQPEWINNAYFLSLRSGRVPAESVRRSFEWLLLQAQPDGLVPDYNAGVPPILPGTAYLGATLTRQPELLWLAGRGLETFAARGLALPAQPGVERAVELEGRSPSSGSCLLYADSGLPNRAGPLAPDKIVFRDGWTGQSAYALLNLRFSGWHRYRATNALVALWRGGETLVGEKPGSPFSWLPLERRIFRDKRIPREHLNGLLVAPTGFAAALGQLIGFGGLWAQDPPHFARVERFETGANADSSVTSVSDWRGWSHRRTVVFPHGGPIVVLDEARGPSRAAAAIAWHVAGEAGAETMRFPLGRDAAMELALVPLEEHAGRVEVRKADRGGPNLDLLYRPAGTGRLRLASVFLPGRWVGAHTQVRTAAGAARTLEISSEAGRLSVPLP
jgi:hypothetical protein